MFDNKSSQSRGIYNKYHKPVNLQKLQTTFGDHAQIAGSRSIYHGSVNRSNYKTIIIGENAQVGKLKSF